MEDKLWYHDDVDLVKAIQGPNWKEIWDYVVLNKQLLNYLRETGQRENLRKTIQYGYGELNFFKNYLEGIADESNAYAAFLLGSLFGTLEFLDRITYREDMKEFKEKNAIEEFRAETAAAMKEMGATDEQVAMIFDEAITDTIERNGTPKELALSLLQ